QHCACAKPLRQLREAINLFTICIRLSCRSIARRKRQQLDPRKQILLCLYVVQRQSRAISQQQERARTIARPKSEMAGNVYKRSTLFHCFVKSIFGELLVGKYLAGQYSRILCTFAKD